jgi:hypothetical protein
MKKLQMFALAVGVLLLAGCGNKNADKPTESAQSQQPGMENNQIQNQGAGGIVSSIKDAMGLGKEMKCTYKMKIGNEEMETVTYVNGKKYMGTTMVAGNLTHMLFNEDAMYTWTEGQPQGMKMTTACSEELAKNTPQTGDQNLPAPADPTGEKTFDNAMDVNCEPASGVDFSVPTGVTFTDQCEMMKNVLKNIPGGANIPKNMPPVNIPQEPTL